MRQVAEVFMVLVKFIQSIQRLAKSLVIVFSVTSVFCATSAYAYTPPSLTDMLQNLTETMPDLMMLVTALAYVIGMYLVVRGIGGLRSYGESRTHHTQQEAKGHLITIAVGAALLYLPSSVHTGISTFWTNSSPLAYVPSGTSGPWSDLLQDVFTIVQFIGTVAFIRGLIMLSQLSGHGGGHQASLGKAMTHMIAGIFCINIYQFLQTVLNTLALGNI